MNQDRLKIIDYSFATGRKRAPDDSGLETIENIKPNNEFLVKFYLPSADSDKEKHIVIIINGFNEMSPDAYHNDKRGVCKLLADRNIASVLIPISNHMNRMPKGVYPDEHEPKHLVTVNKDRFYEGYRQTIADIEKLARLISTKSGRDGKLTDGSKFSDFFDSNTKIHLLGYSIGGLGVLSAFLKAYYEKENLYNSCILLSSGANFQSLHPEDVIGLDKNTWKRIKHYYLGKVYMSKESEKSLMNRIFEMVLLGEKREIFLDCMSELSNRILVIIGALDDVSSPESLVNIEPEETGLAIIKVPSLEHPFASKGWLAWYNWIMDCIGSFMQSHASKVIKEETYRKTALKRRISRLIMTTKSNRVLEIINWLYKKLSKNGTAF